jgi:phosphoribosylglycinamide formyltransferase-1
MALARIAVLISGRGSNLAALIAASQHPRFAGAITQVVSNRADAAGLAIARRQGIATTVVDHRDFPSRAAFDARLVEVIDAGEPDLVVLAGFMRVLGAAFVGHYAGRLLNIHPSLLPAYPGLQTHRRALADGVRVHGCTVHFVTPDVDVGPIVAQGVVPVLPDDDEATLAARVLAAEHRLLPAAVGWFCAGRLVQDGACVRLADAPRSEGLLLSPVIGPGCGDYRE